MNQGPSPPTPTARNDGDNHFNFLQNRPPPLSSATRALSLLSSSPQVHETQGIMPLVPSGIGQYGFVQEMHSEAMLTDSSGTTLQFQGMFNNDHDGSSSSGIKQQTLSF
nr:squamosa promoter-binding-like protein 16 [Tanacetum cinerariifolium]